MWKRLHVWIENSHRLSHISQRILWSNREFSNLQHLLNEHPEYKEFFFQAACIPSWKKHFSLYVQCIDQGWVVQSRVSAEFQVRYESLKSKFSFIVFLYNLMISCPKIKKIIPKNAFEQKKKKPGLKFKSWITVTSYWCKIWLLNLWLLLGS